jgi:carboxypeptidase Q
MTRRVLVLVPVVLAVAVLRAEERVDTDAIWKIRREGMQNSKVMQTVRVLADVYGPRLTGSPNLKAAGEWAIQQMQAWGLRNGRLEPWDFGHPGWVNERMAVHVIAPVKDSLVAEVLAWTPGTNGAVRGQLVKITLPARATGDELTAHLEKLKPLIAGKMVLVGEPQKVGVIFNKAPLRRDDSEVVNQINTPDNAAAPATPAPPATAPAPAAAAPRPLTAREIADRVNAFMVANGVLVRVNDAARDHGQIRAFNNQTFDTAKAPPTLVMRNEDFGRLSRLLDDKRAVELEVDIVNRSYPEGRTAFNTIAEIPGTDKADEVIMLGGHLDSWHAATGATDNAIGCAVMMEAARLIAANGLKPRRTIRVALWSGEEQGLLGSQAYVKEHFGFAEEPKPAHAKFGGYFNIDSGTGRARAMTVFGPREASVVLSETVAALADLGMLGARSTSSRARGGTDSTSFNEAGLPGINMLQDPIEYQTYTWHTNLDTYERIVEDDVKKSAVAIATAVYHLAMRDQLLPRFAAGQMPKRPTPPPATPAPTTSTK